MSFVTRLLDRLLPALFLGVGVTLLSAGLLTYAPAGLGDVATPTSNPAFAAGDPLFSTPPGSSSETAAPGAPSAPGATPTGPGTTPGGPDATAVGGPQPTPAAPEPTLDGASTPGSEPEPQATPQAPQAPAATPWPVMPTPTPNAEPPVGQAPVAQPTRIRYFASRVRVSSLRINLPVVSSDLRVRGNRAGYPLCDVAQYLSAYSQPGEAGSTFIYGHAQRGMFLPLLRASRINNGASMIGALVEVWTTENKRYLYKIYKVKRHAINFNLANSVLPGEQRLILQTSEGPSGTRGKLMIAAHLRSVSTVSSAEAQPTPHPRVCLPY